MNTCPLLKALVLILASCLPALAQMQSVEVTTDEKTGGTRVAAVAAGATTSAMKIGTALSGDIVAKVADELFLVRKNASVYVDTDVVLPNGTRVTPESIVVLRDGTKRTMMNNQMLTTEGTITPLAGGFSLPPLAGTVATEAPPARK